MNGFRFKGMANNNMGDSSGRPAPVQDMRELSIQQQKQNGVKRSLPEDDSCSKSPSKRGKTADSSVSGSVLEDGRKSMKSVWEQAHFSRCTARLRGLEAELAAAKSRTEESDLKCRIAELRRSMKEEGYDVDAMQLD